MEKMIKVTPEIRVELMKEFPVSEKTVYNALNFLTGGYAAEQIRRRTVELGGKISARGVDFKVGADQCCFIRRTDNMPKGKNLFGTGFPLSDNAAAERAAATKWELSDRERQLQKMIK